MKLIIFVLTFILCGCGLPSTEINSMKRPITVIAKDSFAIVLKGADNIVKYLKAETYLGGALANSYNVGDTLK